MVRWFQRMLLLRKRAIWQVVIRLGARARKSRVAVVHKFGCFLNPAQETGHCCVIQFSTKFLKDLKHIY